MLDKSRNQYVHATVNVMKVDKAIPYPHDAMADGIWIHVFGLLDEEKDDEWWGFDKLEVTAMHSFNAESNDPVRSGWMVRTALAVARILWMLKAIEKHSWWLMR